MWNRDSPVSVATLVTPTWSDHWLHHPQGASLGSAPTMCKPKSTWSHSFPVPVSPSLQVSLLASQSTESAAGGSPVESLQSQMILTMSHWSSGRPVCFPPQIPWGDLCETGILLLALSRYKLLGKLSYTYYGLSRVLHMWCYLSFSKPLAIGQRARSKLQGCRYRVSLQAGQWT
jgi:hypothetical protein